MQYNVIVGKGAVIFQAPANRNIAAVGAYVLPWRQKGGERVAIKFDKLISLLKERGMKPQTLKNANVVGNATLEKLKGKQVTGGTGKHYYGSVDTRAINNICEYLKCQPGDIMEWVPDEPSEAESPETGNDENEGRD